MFHKSLILFLLTETPSLLALLGKGWSAWVAQFQSVAEAPFFGARHKSFRGIGIANAGTRERVIYLLG